jgi:hypothetical protein
MSYLLNLTTDVGSSARRESSHSSTSNSIRALSGDVGFKGFSREAAQLTLKTAFDDFQTSARFNHSFTVPGVVLEGREGEEEEDRLNAIPASFTIVIAQIVPACGVGVNRVPWNFLRASYLPFVCFLCSKRDSAIYPAWETPFSATSFTLRATAWRNRLLL